MVKQVAVCLLVIRRLLMNSHNSENINRRNFLKLLGLGSAASLTLLTGCDINKKNSSDSSASGLVPTDKMTYRVNPKTKNKVSLLGYGCMRWPMLPKSESTGAENNIDQEAVKALVDYAIAHGVNYFDYQRVVLCYSMGIQTAKPCIFPETCLCSHYLCGALWQQPEQVQWRTKGFRHPGIGTNTVVSLLLFLKELLQYPAILSSRHLYPGVCYICAR